MASLNTITIIGRLTDDPDLKYTHSGISYAKFSVAVSRKYSKQKDTDFFNIMAWRKLGDICGKYLKKGKQVCISGQMQMSKYKTEDGSTVVYWQLVAEDMQMLGKKDDATAPPPESEPFFEDEGDIGPDEVPF